MMLADLGAAVLKVESLEGDSFRELPGFFGWNRGKRSIALNLKTPEGRQIVERLAREGDVLMENWRPGVADRLGVGHAHLLELNPKLIYCSVTAFGSTGPYADRPGFDPAPAGHGRADDAAGLRRRRRSISGPRRPTTTRRRIAAQAVLAALFVRQRTGRGQRIETSLLRGVLALQSGIAIDYPGKPTLIRENPTYRLYQGSDGQWFFVACGNQSFWVKLCTALGMEDFADDPRFASWLLRIQNSEALLPIIEKRFGEKPRAEWLEVLAAHDIPAAPVKTIQEFMDDPAVQHHDMVHEYDHPDVGRLRADRPAARLRRHADPRSRPAADARPAHRRGAARARLRRHRRARSPRQEGGAVHAPTKRSSTRPPTAWPPSPSTGPPCTTR